MLIRPPELMVRFLQLADTPETRGQLVIPVPGMTTSVALVGTDAGLQLDGWFQYSELAPVQVAANSDAVVNNNSKMQIFFINSPVLIIQ